MLSKTAFGMGSESREVQLKDQIQKDFDCFESARQRLA